MNDKQYSDLLLNQTNDLIWVVDHDLNLVYANKAYLNFVKEVTGVEKSLNTPVLVEGFGKGNMEKWKSLYQTALSGENFTIEERFLHPKKKEIEYGHISFTPLSDKDGDITSVACRNTDITSNVKEKYRANSLLDASLDVFCTINEAGKFVFVSSASAEHWGYTPEELIGKPYQSLIIKEDLEKTEVVANEIKAGKKVLSFQNRYQKKNGDIAYNFWSARWDDKDKLVYCVARDITEKIDKELWGLNKQAYELAKVGSWEYDMTKDKLFWSDEVFRLHDLEPDAFVPSVETAIDYYKEEHKEYVTELIERTLTEEVKLDYEAIIITESKKEKWVRVIGTPKFIGGKCIKLIGSFQDITDQKNVEKKIKLISERLQVATDAAGMGIWDWDILNDKLIWDKKMYELFHVDPSEFNGAYEAWESTVHPDDRQQANKDVQDAINGVSDFDSSFRIIGKDKSVHHIKADGIIIRDESGKAIRMVGANWDITELISTQKMLEKSLNEKELLIKEVHHRVKNNLAILSGLLELEIITKGDNSVLLEAINRIRSIGFVHELLYQSDSMIDIPFSEFLNSYLYHIENTFSIPENIDIEFEILDGVLNVNEAIPLGLLINELVTNSLKYGVNEGGLIEIKLSKHSDNGSLYRFYYRDSGPGIILENLSKGTLGMQLIETLLVNLDAEYEINMDGKFEVMASFKPIEKGAYGYPLNLNE